MKSKGDCLTEEVENSIFPSSIASLALSIALLFTSVSPPCLSMLSSPSGSSDSEDSSRSKRVDGERREEEGDREERAKREEHPSAPPPQPRPPPLPQLSDAEAAAAGAALKRSRATARARRKGSLLSSSSSAPRTTNVVRNSSSTSSRPPPPPPPARLLDPALATSDADAAARLRAWLSSTLSRPGAARAGAYARHRAAVVRKALALLETRRSEAQDAELQALLGGLSL